MQVIDSSALLAVLYSEPDEALFSDMLASRPGLISAVNLHESQISVFGVLARHMPQALRGC